MECTEGWLEPLVARIANDRSVVAVPYIDRIDKDEMSYIAPDSIYVNNLRWSLFFNWLVKVLLRWKMKSLFNFLSLQCFLIHTGNLFQKENGNELNMMKPLQFGHQHMLAAHLPLTGNFSMKLAAMTRFF